MKTSIFKCFIFILNIFFDYFHVLNISFVIILLILFLLLLLLQLSFCYYIVQTPLPYAPTPFIKGSRGWTFSKLMALWDLKTVARKGGLFSLGMGGCHINYITVFLEVFYDGT